MSKRSNRYGSDPLDKPDRERDPAKEAATQAKARPAIDIKKLKCKLASKPTERAERKGGPLPSDFHWGHYPDED
jgi:hypothetical protein